MSGVLLYEMGDGGDVVEREAGQGANGFVADNSKNSGVVRVEPGLPGFGPVNFQLGQIGVAIAFDQNQIAVG
jgi:hypothetical protein